jgi:hypothetical protein
MHRPLPLKTRALACAAVGLLTAGCQLLSLPSSLLPAPTPTAPNVERPAPTAGTAGATSTPWILPPTLVVPTAEARLQEEAMLPAFAGDADAPGDRTQYWVEANVDFDPKTYQASIRGQNRIRFTVPDGPPIQEIPLMLWPNDGQYAAEMRAGPALINGVESLGRADLDGIVQWYSLAEPARPGETLDISLPFEIEAGGPIGGARPQRFGITSGVFIAPTFYPLIPRRVEGAWQVEPAPYGGDTTNSDTAFYDVSLTIPSALSLAASGVETDRVDHGDGTTTLRFVSGPMRDFAFALGPLEPKERTVDGVVVRAWTLPQHAQDAGPMLDAAARQVSLLDERVGQYPFAELDVVDAPGAFGGIEYPGLVFIGTVGSDWLIPPTVHEVGHQWFYSLIGDDQLNEPWLDEAMAQYSEVMYYDAYGGPGAGSGVISDFRARARSAPDPTLPIGMPVSAYSSVDEYAAIVYGKGGVFLDALRGEIGDDAFDAFLKSYFDEYRYGFASAKEFEATAEAACDCNLDRLFNLWVWQGGEIPGL